MLEAVWCRWDEPTGQISGMNTPQLLISALALGAAYALVAVGFVLRAECDRRGQFRAGRSGDAGGCRRGSVRGAAAGLLVLPVRAAPAVIGSARCWLGDRRGLFLPLNARPPSAVFVSTIAVASSSCNRRRILRPGAALGPGGLTRGGDGAAGDHHRRRADRAGASYLVVSRTQLGRRLRATAQDREMARASASASTPMIALQLRAGAALAGAAGLLLGQPVLRRRRNRQRAHLKAYIAVSSAAGARSRGAVAGALLIALFEVLSRRLLSAVWRTGRPLRRRFCRPGAPAAGSVR